MCIINSNLNSFLPTASFKERIVNSAIGAAIGGITTYDIAGISKGALVNFVFPLSSQKAALISSIAFIAIKLSTEHWLNEYSTVLAIFLDASLLGILSHFNKLI